MSTSMKRFLRIALIGIFLTCSLCAESCKANNTEREEPAIAVMYAHPELAENFTRQMIQEFAPNPESLKIEYCKAKYYVLYKAYITNCVFETEDAYGDLRTYKIQVTVQVLPDGEGGVKYNALDLKELQ